jgi:tRNA modification GTPase
MLEGWQETLVGCLAHMEAVLDFGDDERGEEIKLNESALAPLIPRLLFLRDNMQRSLRSYKRAALIREGLRVALVGRPNAGKSSLMNKLAGRPAAIVAPTPGTTRDLLEVGLDIAGVRCNIVDTAGLRECHIVDAETFITSANSISYSDAHNVAVDEVEIEGIRRAKVAYESANLRLLVIDCSVFLSKTDPNIKFDETAAIEVSLKFLKLCTNF